MHFVKHLGKIFSAFCKEVIGKFYPPVVKTERPAQNKQLQPEN